LVGDFNGTAQNPLSAQRKAGLWIRVGWAGHVPSFREVTMFLYVYVDIFAFYKPGTIDDILVGRVWEFDISQGWALGALALMTIPSLMIFLSLTLPARAARMTNLVVASLFVLVSVGNAAGETWAFVWLGSAVESVLLLVIIRYAWNWPRSVD
jgi:hypothetical protein